MTVASQLTSAQVPCNGTTTQFNFSNKIFQATDLVVTLIDNLGNQYAFSNGGSGNTFTNSALGLSYTVYNIDVDTGCYIIFTAAPTNGWTLDGRSNIPQLQSTSIKNQGPFNPELHEEFFDKATRMLQDLLRKAYTFGVHGPDLESTPWPTLPLPAARANTNLGFDGIGRLTVSAALAAATLSAASIGGFLYPVQAQEGATVQNIYYAYGWPERYGCSTAAADNAANMQNCFNAGYKVNGRGIQFQIASNVTNTLPLQIFEDVALVAASTFTSLGTMWTSGAAATSCIIRNPYLDGSIAAGGNACIAGTLLDVQSGRTRVYNIVGNHFQNIGVSLSAGGSGDSGVSGYQLQQWNNGDAGWATQSNWTGIGIYHNRADCFSIAGEGSFSRWCGFPYRIGPNGQTVWMTRTHGYNSTYKGSGAAPSIDSVNIKIDEGASSINIDLGYLDNGHIDSASTDVHFFGGMPLQTAGDATGGCQYLDAFWIRWYAAGIGFPYPIDADLATSYLASSNLPNGANAATSVMRFYSEKVPNNLISLSANGATGTLQYTATSNNAPQVNSTFYLNGVGTTAAFNASINPSACVLGNLYQIDTIGNTNWALIGGPTTPVVGQCFVASGPAAGGSTGVCRGAWTVATSSQTAGGAGVGVVTLTFATSINGTGTGGTIQRAWSGNMLGIDAADGVMPNGSHQRIRINGGEVHYCGANGTLAADTLISPAAFFTESKRSGNRLPVVFGYGNQNGQYPFMNMNLGYLNLIATSYGGTYQSPATPFPGVRIGFNLTGTSFGDDGSTNGQATIQTQNGNRIGIDGFSGGLKSMYSMTDGYMNLGTGSFRYNTVYATTGAINTSDEREKDKVIAPVPGRSYLMRLQVVPFKWKVRDKHIEHGKYVIANTGEEVPGYDPTKNHNDQMELRAAIARYPGPKQWIPPKHGGEGHWNGRTEEQEVVFQRDCAALDGLVKLALSITRTEEVVTDLPGVRTHVGVMAQNIKAALDAEGITDYAGWTLNDPNDKNSRQAVRTDQAILMPTVVTVQEHDKMIEDQEARIAKLEAQVAQLLAKADAA